MKTFVDLQQEVLRYFDLASEPSNSADFELVKAAINTAHQKRCVEDNWQFMLSSQFTVDIVAGQQTYILPFFDFNRFHYMWSPQNKRFAVSTPMRSVSGSSISFNEQRDSDNLYYEIIPNGSMVKAQPTTPDTLEITSSEAETGTPKLYIEGYMANGEFVTEEIDETSPSSFAYASITYIAKTDDFIGVVTLATSGGQVLEVLTSTQYGKQYSVLRFHNIPTANETFQFKYLKNPRILTRNFDIPNIPFPYSNVLIYDTLLDLATYNEVDSESVNLWREKQQELLAGLYMYKLEPNTISGFGNYIGNNGML